MPAATQPPQQMQLYRIEKTTSTAFEYVVAPNLGVALLKWRQENDFSAEVEPYSVTHIGSKVIL